MRNYAQALFVCMNGSSLSLVPQWSESLMTNAFCSVADIH
jgi:hypothetical protein